MYYYYIVSRPLECTAEKVVKERLGTVNTKYSKTDMLTYRKIYETYF